MAGCLAVRVALAEQHVVDVVGGRSPVRVEQRPDDGRGQLVRPGRP